MGPLIKREGVMPNYTYRCKACKKTKEIEQKITDEPLKVCPHCKKEAFERVPSSDVAFQFKGSGFYKTDYSQEKKDGDSKGGCGSSQCGCK